MPIVYVEAVLWCLAFAFWVYKLFLLVRGQGFASFYPRSIFYYLTFIVALVAYGKDILERLILVW